MRLGLPQQIRIDIIALRPWKNKIFSLQLNKNALQTAKDCIIMSMSIFMHSNFQEADYAV